MNQPGAPVRDRRKAAIARRAFLRPLTT